MSRRVSVHAHSQNKTQTTLAIPSRPIPAAQLNLMREKATSAEASCRPDATDCHAGHAGLADGCGGHVLVGGERWGFGRGCQAVPYQSLFRAVAELRKG